METLLYLKGLYLSCISQALKRTRNSLVVLIGVCCLVVVWYMSAGFFSQLGIAGGFLRALLEAACLTFYLSWVRDSLQQNRVRISDLKEFDWGLFQAVISVLFILFLLQWVVTMLVTGMDAGWVYFILKLLFVLLLNSLPEVLYISRIDGWSGVQESFSFTYRNWIEWYLPTVLLLAPVGLQFDRLAVIFAKAEVLLPTSILLEYPDLFAGSPLLMMLSIPVLIVFSHFMMLFRGVLFQELEGGNRRQRIFRHKSS